jgi:hypothetical protein
VKILKPIYVILLGVLAISAIAMVMLVQYNPITSLDIEVEEAIYPENISDFTNTTIEFTLKNPTSRQMNLRNIEITSVLDGNEIGTGNIEEIILEANSEKEIKLIILEDWTDVPFIDPSLMTWYDFSAESPSLLGKKSVEINKIKPTSRQVVSTQVTEPDNELGYSEEQLDKFYDNIRSGGPPKDGIPPIDVPQYITVDLADAKLDDDDVVFVMDLGDTVKVYPQRILVWHEIVNDKVDNKIVSITYCPLTGSTIGYYGELGEYDSDYGTSGKLINSNLVMYDRETDSYWPQILGTSIRGARKGETLNTFNVIWSRWDLVKKKFPDALVLSEATGFIRSYGRDPYGQYIDKNSYYNSGGPFFPVMNEDNRLEPKEVVIGIKHRGKKLAISKKNALEQKVINLILGDTPIVAIYDNSLDAVRVFSRTLDDSELSFTEQEGVIVDQTGSTWSFKGIGLSGEHAGKRLEPITHFDVMWFGWVSYYPESEIHQE